jgi:hypothetical protein
MLSTACFTVDLLVNCLLLSPISPVFRLTRFFGGRFFTEKNRHKSFSLP